MKWVSRHSSGLVLVMMGWELGELVAAKYSNFLFPFSLSLCWPGWLAALARVIGPLGVHFSFSGSLPLLSSPLLSLLLPAITTDHGKWHTDNFWGSKYLFFLISCILICTFWPVFLVFCPFLLIFVLVHTTYNICQYPTEYITWPAMRVCSGGPSFIFFYEIFSTCRIIALHHVLYFSIVTFVIFLNLFIGKCCVFINRFWVFFYFVSLIYWTNI